jgi:hypothetical protein
MKFFDMLSTNAKLLIPFVASLSNHIQIRLNQTFPEQMPFLRICGRHWTYGPDPLGPAGYVVFLLQRRQTHAYVDSL